MADFFGETVRSESFEQVRHLTAAQFRQVEAKSFVLQAANIKLAANDGAEQVLVVRIEQVEPGLAAAFLFSRLREFVEFVSSGAGIFNRREEFQVPPVGRFQEFAQAGRL